MENEKEASDKSNGEVDGDIDMAETIEQELNDIKQNVEL